MNIGLRKYLSEDVKQIILNSLPYKIYSRLPKKSFRFGLEVTTKCNLNCIMCTRAELLAKKEIAVGNIDEKIVDRVIVEMVKFVKAGFEVEFAPMGLGEPLLYPDLIKVFKKIRKSVEGVRIILVTNGVLLTDQIIKDLVDVGVDEISISLNVRNSEDYKKYLKADNYKRVVENVTKLIKYRNKKGSTKIFIQYLDYKNEKSAVFAKEYAYWQKIMNGDDKCYLHPIVNQAGFKDGVKKDKSESYPCSMPGTRVSIKINGDMYPCDPCFYNGSKKVADLCVGNIIEESIFEIFNDKKSKLHQILEKMKQGNYKDIPTCEKCNTYKLNPNMYFKKPEFIKSNNIWW